MYEYSFLIKIIHVGVSGSIMVVYYWLELKESEFMFNCTTTELSIFMPYNSIHGNTTLQQIAAELGKRFFF